MHLILVDGNNLGFAGMANPRLSAGDKNTQATFTVIKSLRRIYLDNPKALIMVLWDGRSWRHECASTFGLPEYKGNREQTEKQVEDRQAYYEQKNSLIKGLTMLGVMQCSASNMEADDLAEIYAKSWKGDKVTLISGDKDWLQLVDQRTVWIDPIRDRQCTNVNFKAFTGFDNTKQFLEAKYLLGDTGDNIKGLKGVGAVAVERLFANWNSVSDFLADDNRQETWKTLYGKKMPAILENESEVLDVMTKNESLMNLSTISRPEPKNLVRSRQDLDSESFKAFCYENAFLSFLKDYDKFLLAFKENTYVGTRQTSEVT